LDNQCPRFFSAQASNVLLFFRADVECPPVYPRRCRMSSYFSAQMSNVLLFFRAGVECPIVYPHRCQMSSCFSAQMSKRTEVSSMTTSADLARVPPSRCRERFYESQFRPKNFSGIFLTQTLNKFAKAQKQDLLIYLAVMDNDLGF
jgi:hypothetical protein